MVCIGATLAEGMKSSDRCFRKLFVGMVEFYPELNCLVKIWELLKLVCRINMDITINRVRVRKLDHSYRVEATISHPPHMAMAHREASIIEYLVAKTNSYSMRLAFFYRNE